MRAGRVFGATVAVAALVGAVLVVNQQGATNGRDSDSRASSNHTGAAGTDAAAGKKLSNPVTDGDGSEVIRQPEGTKSKGLPGLRAVKQTVNASFLTAPLPASASREGGMVKGFPVKIIPVLTGATVQSSGVSTTSTTMQISVVATSSKSPASVLAFYRKSLTAHGFAEGSAPAAGGSTASQFTRGKDHVMVTTAARGKGTTYSVFGTLHVRARG